MSANLMFDGWLESTRILQRMSFEGDDPATFPNDRREFYLMYNAFALIKELCEAMDEVDWKPWTVTHKGFYNRDAFVGEIVDVLHFAANCLVAAGCSDDELSKLYKAKQQKNRDRMASGTYSDAKEKCPQCYRALDDDAVLCKRIGPEEWWCADPERGGTITGYISEEVLRG